MLQVYRNGTKPLPEGVCIDSYQIIECPVGEGIAIEEDASSYECYLEEFNIDYKDVTIVYYFNNDLPYYFGDTTVLFFNKLNGELIKTDETAVITFAEHQVIMFKKEDTLLSMKGYLQCVK